MSKIIEELEEKFGCIETKIRLKIVQVKKSYRDDIKSFDEKYNQKYLAENYSKELNAIRDGLLNQLSLYLTLEIDHVNEADERKKIYSVRNEIKNFEFKRGLVKSSKICLIKLIKSHFKFNRIFSPFELIKYKYLLGLDTFILTNSEEKNISLEDLFLENTLIMASVNGRLEKIKKLVQIGADVNARNMKKSTALILASKYGHFEIVKYLVEYGADVNAINRDYETALMFASENGHLEMVQYLVEHGADVNAESEDGNKALISAFEKGHFDIVDYLVQNIFTREEQNKKLDSPFHCAIKNNDLKVVKHYVENGADVNEHDSENKTGLIVACENGHLEMVKYLVKNGADLYAEDNYKNAAVKIAFKKGHFEILEYFFQIEAEYKFKVTELLPASSIDDLEIVNYFLEQRSDFNAKNKDEKKTSISAFYRFWFKIGGYKFSNIKISKKLFKFAFFLFIFFVLYIICNFLFF